MTLRERTASLLARWRRGGSTTTDEPHRRPGDSEAAEATRTAALITSSATRSAARLQVVGALTGALIGALAAIVTSGPPATSGPDPVEATIVNTGPAGAAYHAEPRLGSGASYGPHEGYKIDVVCQRRDGEPVSDDDPAPGQPSPWPVWDRVSDGQWIPDIWTDLPKQPGPTPPRGLPTC